MQGANCVQNLAIPKQTTKETERGKKKKERRGEEQRRKGEKKGEERRACGEVKRDVERKRSNGKGKENTEIYVVAQ